MFLNYKIIAINYDFNWTLPALETVNSDDPEVYNRLGDAYKKSGLEELAIAAYNKAISVRLQSLEPKHEDRVEDPRKEFYESSILQLQRLTQQDPENPDHHIDLGLAYYHSGEYQKAVEEFLVVIGLTPNDSDIYYYLGDAYAELNDFGNAIIAYRKALLINPLKEHDFKGLLNTRIGLYEHSLMRAKNALKSDPDNPDHHYDLAFTYLNMGYYEEAILAFERVVSINETDAESFYFLGRLYLKLRQLEKAKDAFYKASTLNPKFAEAFFGLSIAYRLLDENQKAIDAHIAAISLNVDVSASFQNPPSTNL